MKKIRLLLVTFGLFMAIVSSGTGLSFRMTNPRIQNGGPSDYIVFDIEIQASTTSTFLFSGQAILNFNNSVLDLASSTALSNTLTNGSYNDWIFPFASKPKYNITITTNGGVFNVAWTANSGLDSRPGNSTYFNEVPTSWQPVVTVYAKIIDSSLGSAGITFNTSAMSNQQSYHVAASTNTVYDPVDFQGDMNTLYVGRIYANSVWSQVGGAVNWATAVNTSVWDLTATIPAGSLSNASAVRIHSGATLTIPPTGQLTATSLDNNTASGLTIQSDATGTGSLITSTTTGTGTAVVQRYMIANKWHMVSSSVPGQSVANFLATNGNIPTKNVSGTDYRGMKDYTTLTDVWNPLFTNATTGDLDLGKAFVVRTASDAAVSFTGTLNAGTSNIPVSTAGYLWNFIGNPFSSAVNLTNGDGSFYSQNSANINGTYGLYIWDESVSATQYTVVNLSTPVNGSLGQGFFVKAAVGATNMPFTTDMQLHNTIALKSGASIPEIKLIALNDNKTVSTSIKFISGTSRGLDPGYDAGFLKLDPTIGLYTRLVEDIGIDFAIQCLPNNDFQNMIIPVGIESMAGGNVVFSAELLNLPLDCKAILEDKVLKKFTDLSKNVYSATIDANLSISDRFRLHTSDQTTGLDMTGAFAGKLIAYGIRNIEIRVKGEVSKQAVATLYDVQGRVVLVKNLEEGNLNIIPTPNIKTGIYMLYVKDNQRIQGFKIPLTE